MNTIPDTKRLADAVVTLASTLVEIMTERLRVIAETQKLSIAQKTIEPIMQKSIESFMTKKQVAEHFQVCLRTIDTWMSKGYLPYYRLNRKVLFKLSDVHRHLDEKYRIGGRGTGY